MREGPYLGVEDAVEAASEELWGEDWQLTLVYECPECLAWTSARSVDCNCV